MSAIGGNPEYIYSYWVLPLVTHKRHSGGRHSIALSATSTMPSGAASETSAGPTLGLLSRPRATTAGRSATGLVISAEIAKGGSHSARSVRQAEGPGGDGGQHHVGVQRRRGFRGCPAPAQPLLRLTGAPQTPCLCPSLTQSNRRGT